MDLSWYTLTFSIAVNTVVSGLLTYLAIILFVRINGLRSFSKLSSYDFAVTVAIGSLLASTMLSKDVPLPQGVLAIGTLIFLQALISHWRMAGAKWPDNTPLLLMRNGQVLYENLRAAKVTERDLYTKLRLGNVHSLSDVQAVVMERSGDISVLSGGGEIDAVLLEGVRGAHPHDGQDH